MKKMKGKNEILLSTIILVFLGAFALGAAEWSKVQKDSLNEAAAVEKELFAISDKLWTYAELAMEEHKSAKVLADYLESKGFKVERGVAGMPTAFVATWGSGGPVIGFNVEYDALPGVSQKPVVTKDPVVAGAPGQACGHNYLGVAGIGAALAMKASMEKNRLAGTLKLFGNPGEELCIGKPYFAEAGVYNGVDAFLDWHPGGVNAANATACNAYFNVKYRYYGQTGHGNVPWTARSALDAAVMQAMMVEFLREHVKAGDVNAASTINYSFTEVGPSYPNVISDFTEAWYVGRLPSDEGLADTVRRVTLAAEAAAKATETRMEMSWLAATHVRIPNMTLTKVIDKNLRLVGAPKFTPEEQEFAKGVQKSIGEQTVGLPETIGPILTGWGGVSDNSEMSWFAPFGNLTVVTRGAGAMGHNWSMAAFGNTAIAKKGYMVAAKTLALSGLDILQDPRILEEAKKEWQQRLAGRTYKPLYPAGNPVPLDVNRKEMEKYRKEMEKFYID
jgi:aminobenzoyl-glutamate utilization protein B